jgi:dephospho-CoA kinase
MKRIGITGGIGSGKSFVSSIFLKYNFKSFNSDFEAKNIINNNNEIKNQIIEKFGVFSYNNDTLNSEYISNIIFKDNKKLGQINKIVHPKVYDSYREFIIKNKNFNTVFESALLFDYENFKNNDYNILITCPENLRIERIMARGNLSYDDIKRIINSQIDYDKKKHVADFCIENIESQTTRKHVTEIIEKIIM